MDITLTVPATNTDGTKPANISSFEVYAVTLPPTPTPPTEAQILKIATKVASVEVKAPADPNVTVDPDDPDDPHPEMEPLEGKGLDQGAVAHVRETLTPAMMTLAAIPKDKNAARQAERPSPLAGPPPGPTLRSYAIVGVSAKGKKGPLSKRVNVPLVPPPPPPASVKIAYDEKAITVTWPALASLTPAPAAASDSALASRPLNATTRSVAYNVYDATGPAGVKLTQSPVAETTFADPRVEWGARRCYVVRTAETVAGVVIESDASPMTCDTLKDTFAPAPPKALNAVPSDGVITLIWEPSPEKDLAGYIVLRAAAPSDDLQPITTGPIHRSLIRSRTRCLRASVMCTQ